MTGTTVVTRRREPELPVDPACAGCGARLAEPYGWCGNCRAAYCVPCGRSHYCLPSCRQQGCHAGLCARLVSGGVLATTWGLPDE